MTLYFRKNSNFILKRVPKTGGTILDLVPAQIDYWADSVAVSDEHLYWADGTTTPGTHRLRRIPKGGGGVEDLAPGRSGLGGVNLSANYVYWGGVWRLQVGSLKVYLPVITRQSWADSRRVRFQAAPSTWGTQGQCKRVGLHQLTECHPSPPRHQWQ